MCREILLLTKDHFLKHSNSQLEFGIVPVLRLLGLRKRSPVPWCGPRCLAAYLRMTDRLRILSRITGTIPNSSREPKFFKKVVLVGSSQIISLAQLHYNFPWVFDHRAFKPGKIGLSTSNVFYKYISMKYE